MLWAFLLRRVAHSPAVSPAMSRRYIHHTPAARIPPFPRSHAPTGEVQSLDPSDIAAAAAKQKQREQDAEKSDGSSVTPDDEEEIVMDECKYTDDELLKTRTPLLTGSDVADKREEIRDYFHRTFSLYEKLFDVLVADSTFAMQPEKLRHPLIFYFGQGDNDDIETNTQTSPAKPLCMESRLGVCAGLTLCLFVCACACQVTLLCFSSTSFAWLVF